MTRTTLAALAALLAVSGCAHNDRALDGHARAACTYGFLGGVAQLQHNEVAVDRAVVDAFQEATQSRNSVVKTWVSVHSAFGTSAHKSQAQANDAVLRLLQVCRGLGWHPTAPSSAPALSTSSGGSAR